MDNYIPGNYKWKESSFGSIKIVDFKAKSNKWESEYALYE